MRNKQALGRRKSVMRSRPAHAVRPRASAAPEVAAADETMPEPVGLAEVAGVVSHQLNNLLTIILGSTELLLDDPGIPAPAHARLEEIARAGDRAAELIRKLQTVGAMPPIAPPDPLDDGYPGR